MRQSPDSNEKALFVEVPKAVNAMSEAEKKEFAEAILRVMEGK